MRRHLLTLAALCVALAAAAQTPQYKVKIKLTDGRHLTALAEEVDSITFASLGKVQATISERYHTSTSLGVVIEKPENASSVKALCVPATTQIADSDLKNYIEANATVDSEVSYKKAFDFLQPETAYDIYALAYDESGIAGEVTRLTLTTGAKSDDPFTLSSDVTTTTVSYTVTPKDSGLKYKAMCMGLNRYLSNCDAADNAGDILEYFIESWKYWASMYGDSWLNQMWGYELVSGEYSDVQNHLMWDADQVMIMFGMNQDGTLATPIQIEKLHTLAPTPSQNQLTLNLTSTAYRNVAVDVTTTNDDTYFVTCQPAALVEKYATDDALMRALCYEADNLVPSSLARSGNDTWEFRPTQPDTDYYIIAVGLDDGAPATTPVKTKFHHPAAE